MHIPRYATTNLNSMSNQRLVQTCVLLPRIDRTRNVHEYDPFLWGV